MGKTTCCLFLVSFLIVTLFVAEIHGSKQAKALDNLHKSKFRANSQVDRSDDFEAQEINVVHSSDHDHDHQDGLKEKDRIEKLPGQPHVKFSQYGGYVTVDKLAGRAFYYYFVEAHHSKETLPLLLWLNGGIYLTHAPLNYYNL